MKTASPRLLRRPSPHQPVTNVELFFDLVYVFAVTQLSAHLLAHPDLSGALQTLVLFGGVWIAWVYTTWVTNWLDPQQIPTRLVLLGIMLTSLVFSAALPSAFTTRAAAVAIAFVVIQVGRTLFVILALPGHPLQCNFERVMVWTVASSALWIAGVFVAPDLREALWAIAIVVDLAGGEVGFYTPGLGRSATSDWNIEGGHFAERCQAFVLIALGESIVAIGASISGLGATSASEITSFAVAFIGCVALWWIYFDRSAEEGADHLASSDDPGRLGRSAYHFIHPIMVAGIVVVGAADHRVLDDPLRVGNGPTAVMVLGGTVLFLAGHALFKRAIWGVVSVSRIVGILVLIASAGLAPFIPAIVLAMIATVVVVGIGVADRIVYGGADPARAEAA